MVAALSVVIINYNTADIIGRCIEAVQRQENVDFEIIIADNASQDNSLQVIHEMFPNVTLLVNDENLGFGKACNRAASRCAGKYLYFLNPDAEVQPGAFQAMVDFMESNPAVGLAGTRIVYPDGRPQHSVHLRYPGEKYSKATFFELKGEIAWVKGASMIVRKSVFQEVGGFDERFFLYSEETDLCLSIRKSGWSIGYINEATLVHMRGQSERDNLPEDVWRKKFEALMKFYQKHYSVKTVNAIRRADMTKAMWRIFILKFVLPFCADKSKAQMKLSRYRFALEALRKTH
jgi:N-acetylglucosaminyl-diphospho-decaprenol L-rhamnosyltransferase